MIRLIIAFLLLSATSFGQVIKANSNYLPLTVSGGSLCPYNITSWAVSTNWVESPSGVWGPINYAVDGNGEGLGLDIINGDGYIQSDYLASNNQSTAIFLTSSESPISPYYANVEFGLYVSSGDEYNTAINGSYTGLGVTALSGDKMRVIRTGTTVKAQYYRSGSWVDLYTYSTGSSGTLWFGGSSANPGNAVYLTNPKYCN